MSFVKFGLIAIALSTVAVSASAQSLSDVYGRKLVSDQGFVTINGNGTINGVFDGKKLRGRWWTENGNFCRKVSLGGENFGTACQTITMRNGIIKFTTVDGSRTTTYRIQ